MYATYASNSRPHTLAGHTITRRIYIITWCIPQQSDFVPPSKHFVVVCAHRLTISILLPVASKNYTVVLEGVADLIQ